MADLPTLKAEKIKSTIEFEWSPVGFVERLPSGRHRYPADARLKGPGTYRLHAGAWPRQADEWEECWYVGMSATSMYGRIKSHVCEQGQPHIPGAKPFRWILANDGWVAIWVATSLRINGVPEDSIDRALVGRGVEGAAILSNFGFMGPLNRQL